MKDKGQAQGGLHSSLGNLRCPQCERSFLMQYQCNLVCKQCGYVESCEDNFVPNQDNPVQEPIAGV